MAKAIGPGVVCKIIGSANGPRGLSVGRKCVVLWPWQGEPHTVWGQIWRVSALPGDPDFMSEHGGIGRQVDCAEDWLEPLDDEPPIEIPRVVEKDLDLVI